jgi:hypothetical protein
MDKKTAIEKIRKCLALAKSGEPHEAAAALRQAQKLIERFRIEHPELLEAGVSECWAKSGASKTPTRYEVVLASAVAGAFACEMLFSRQLSKCHTRIDGGYSFIGIAPSSDIAAYTFTVLLRQLKRSRVTYIKTALKRLRKNKTAAADQFCEGWVIAVRNLIASVSPLPEQKLAIETYVRVNYARTRSLEARKPQEVKRLSVVGHRSNGYEQGQSATLNRGVGKDAPVALLA